MRSCWTPRRLCQNGLHRRWRRISHPAASLTQSAHAARQTAACMHSKSCCSMDSDAQYLQRLYFAEQIFAVSAFTPAPDLPILSVYNSVSKTATVVPQSDLEPNASMCSDGLQRAFSVPLRPSRPTRPLYRCPTVSHCKISILC